MSTISTPHAIERPHTIFTDYKNSLWRLPLEKYGQFTFPAAASSCSHPASLQCPTLQYIRLAKGSPYGLCDALYISPVIYECVPHHRYSGRVDAQASRGLGLACTRMIDVYLRSNRSYLMPKAFCETACVILYVTVAIYINCVVRWPKFDLWKWVEGLGH